MNYTELYTLDARPDRIDLRDREYLPPLTSLPAVYPSADIVAEYFPRYASDNMVLDQGREGACTGFGLAAMINYLFWRRHIEAHLRTGKTLSSFVPPSRVSMRMLYHLARFYDEWPGEDYQGSSCRGAVKAWHRHGVCTDDKWPYRDANDKVVFLEPADDWAADAAKRPLGVYYRISRSALTDMQAALLDVGAIYVSASVHSGWNRPTGAGGSTVSHDTLPLIEWQQGKTTTGGHAFALVGYNDRGFIVQNSWGDDWGSRGFALLGYNDWLANGTDAWVCVLGVPQLKTMPSHYVDGERKKTAVTLEGRQHAAGLAGDHVYGDREVAPWDASQAYKHTIVMGNEGRVINRLVTRENGHGSVADIALHRPSAFFGGAATPRIAVYAHGGLNDEQSSIRRIQTMAPYFKANGIYPLFLTWKTGFCESFFNILEDSTSQIFHRAEGLDDLLEKARGKSREVVDRTIEIACENLGVKAIWSQMKQNAAEASKKADDDRGAFQLTNQLARLKRDFSGLEIHLIGHSAGSILLGHMLDDFARNDLKATTMTLYAPACSLAFANRYYIRAVEKGVVDKDRLAVYLLSSEREKNDTVGPYGKSLLYLVSRALENAHKSPLLGMIDALDGKNPNGMWNAGENNQLKKWRDFFGDRMEHVNVIAAKEVTTARRWEGGETVDLARIDSAHGSFDNDVDVVEKTLQSIAGTRQLRHRVENLQF